MLIQPYQRAFHWVRVKYVDDPQSELTVADVHRTCGVDADVCQQVLDDLVRARLLVRLGAETYGLRPLTERNEPDLPAGAGPANHSKAAPDVGSAAR